MLDGVFFITEFQIFDNFLLSTSYICTRQIKRNNIIYRGDTHTRAWVVYKPLNNPENVGQGVINKLVSIKILNSICSPIG